MLTVLVLALSLVRSSPDPIVSGERLEEIRDPGEHSFVAGHRGDPATAPENTLPAVRAAIDGPFAYIEVDLALTLDGHAVLMHDETLDRTTTGTGALAEHTLAEVRELDAGSWFGAEFVGTKVPTAEEFLALLASSEKRGLIELKGNWSLKAATSLADSARGHGVLDRLVIVSFDARSLGLIAEAAPEMTRMALMREWPEDPIGALRALGVRGVVASSEAIEEDPEKVDELQAAGLFVAVYTLNDGLKWQEAAELGVDGIVTDRPRTLKQWLDGAAP